ncbi:Gfo/Idh/MocA family oxidoreductase [Luteimonas aestuarii]|uniref:Gfo/Idh/MocA family oxidoreductase n=1 Tax=Luteimonas aestuarii TaxID=453837 RepID=A0A4R5TRN8_9GAMM|nr:Gfo/Idh/MocA family oxidoreductase [Luteimonas aestuarii]TDK20643.1 Gfo/Idh/MocA family oxidoreductase [Luteimonas aestuarii]
MTVRWGILGCGAVTEAKSGPAFAKVPGSALVAVMRRDAALAEDYARRHGVPRWHADAQALIDDPGVDAVYVATPPSTHCQYALMAMAAGKPVYVEKPMAMDAAECDAMLRASREHGVPLFVAYYRRALPRFLLIRDLLADGAIGTPRSVGVHYTRELQPIYCDPRNLSWRVRPEVSGGGLFVDLGSHTLDILDFLLGPLRNVTGEASNRAGAYPAEDTVSMAFTCGDGIRGTGEWDFNATGHRDEIEIVGDRGRLRFATFGDGSIVHEADSGRHEHRVANPAHIQQPLIESIVRQLNGEGRCPSMGDTAARTTRVIDAVLGDYRAGLRDAASGGPGGGIV